MIRCHRILAFYDSIIIFIRLKEIKIMFDKKLLILLYDCKINIILYKNIQHIQHIQVYCIN